MHSVFIVSRYWHFQVKEILLSLWGMRTGCTYPSQLLYLTSSCSQPLLKFPSVQPINHPFPDCTIQFFYQFSKWNVNVLNERKPLQRFTLPSLQLEGQHVWGTGAMPYGWWTCLVATSMTWNVAAYPKESIKKLSGSLSDNFSLILYCQFRQF